MKWLLKSVNAKKAKENINHTKIFPVPNFLSFVKPQIGIHRAVVQHAFVANLKFGALLCKSTRLDHELQILYIHMIYMYIIYI